MGVCHPDAARFRSSPFSRLEADQVWAEEWLILRRFRLPQLDCEFIVSSVRSLGTLEVSKLKVLTNCMEILP